jgi:hypothetical protein
MIERLSGVLLFVLLAATWMVAQNTTSNPPAASPSASSPTQNNQAAPAPNPGSVTGCLSGLPVQGIYVLTTSSGTSDRLSGQIEHLGPMIGQEVQVSGQLQPGATPSPIPPTLPNARNLPVATSVFQVDSAAKTADHCSEPGAHPTSSSNAPTHSAETKGSTATSAASTAGATGQSAKPAPSAKPSAAPPGS